MQTINCKITLDDCYDYAKYNLYNSIGLIIGIFLVVAVLNPDMRHEIISCLHKYIIYFQTLKLEGTLTFYNILILIITFVIKEVIPIIFLYVIFWFCFLRMQSIGCYFSLKSQKNLKIKDKGLYLYNDNNMKFIDWNRVIDFCETPKLYVVSIDFWYFVVLISKRAFSNENESNEFLNFVSSKIAKHK